MRCPNCNVEIPETTKFCPECGAKLTEAAEAPAAPSVSKKPEKKKLIKIMIISASALLACGIIFLVLYFVNPFCMFGHRNTHSEGGPVCTNSVLHICDDCGETVYEEEPWRHEFGYKEVVCRHCGEIRRTCDEADIGHEYENAICGKENTCVKCGEKNLVVHGTDYTYSEFVDCKVCGDLNCDFHCRHCGQCKYTVTVPFSAVVNDYDRGQTNSISNIKAEEGYYGIDVTFTVVCMYNSNGNNTSSQAGFGYKVYDASGVVVDSGTAYSNGAIKVGEKSNGSFTIYRSDMEAWGTYRVEIINIS